MSNQITSLLQKLSIYNEPSNASSTSSNLNESKNSPKLKESNVNENYFHLKIRRLLNSSVEDSFRNVKIVIKSFFEDVKIFLKWVKEKNGISQKESEENFKEIKDKLKKVEKIELDSVFTNISGETIKNFFKNMEAYSFPAIDNNKIVSKKNYTIIIESTHSLKSSIKKKPNQIYKYHLFFTIICEYFKKEHNLMGKFHEFFFEKYFRRSALDMNELLEEKNEVKEISLLDNFILIIACDNSFKIFKETTKKINLSQPYFQNQEGKNFQKLYNKNYKEDKNQINIISSNENNAVQNNYKYFKYIINELNNEKNWVCKAMYFDLYFSLIIPKCEITESLTNINDSINTLIKNNIQLNDSNISLKKEISQLNDKLKKVIEFLNTKYSESEKSELNKILESDIEKEKIQKK